MCVFKKNIICGFALFLIPFFLFGWGESIYSQTKNINGIRESSFYGLEKRHFKVGIGPIPRNFPSNQQGWLDMYTKISDVAEIVVVQSRWNESVKKAGDIPEFLDTIGMMKNRFNYIPQFGITFFHLGGQEEGKADLSTRDNHVNNWSNEDAKQQYKELALSICEKYDAQYLALGVEVNTYYQYHPKDFDLFVTAYKDIYDEIKAKYPQTKVFVTFQLERMKGIGDKTFGASIEPHWQLIDKFGDKLDLVAFTTYPEIEYDSPAEIPEDYYSEIRKHTNKKIAFTEIGWQSTKKTEKDQKDFLLRFLQLTKELDIENVNWVFMHDLPGFGPLKKVGLRKSNGQPKQSWFIWKRLKQAPLE